MKSTTANNPALAPTRNRTVTTMPALSVTESVPMLSVLAPETPVLLAGEIRATVMAVSVRSGPHVNYQVVWWSGLDRHEEWVYAAEVERVDASREIKLGF
jgi:hypothetical protein